MRAFIAYPGTEGSFSWAAARSVFADADYYGCSSFEETAAMVLSGQADYALLPIENSFAGAVLNTYRILENGALQMVGETLKRVEHQLLGVVGSSLSDIRTITSHPQAIAQCDEYLKTLHGVRLIPSENTAISARMIAKNNDRTVAAIASREAAEIYGLTILKPDIHTSCQNTTRFTIVSKLGIPLGHPNKASVVFTVSNEVGALAKVLDSFAASGLNMTRIESRPIPETPFYYFFLGDFEGDVEAQRLHEAMEKAMKHTTQIRLLGIYPKGILND